VWIVGDVEWFKHRGLRPLAYVESVAIFSDAEHIITPSKSGPKRALRRAYDEAGIVASDVAVFDIHATGTPGDLTELALIEEFVDAGTWITARKGQLGHGMANSGGWELTALAMGLARRRIMPTGIDPSSVHRRVTRPRQVVGSDAVSIERDVGVKLMLGIGGITACVVLRRSNVPP
jgi:3-oxoacyl-(acyl-carrier-protein) synthase